MKIERDGKAAPITVDDTEVRDGQMIAHQFITRTLKTPRDHRSAHLPL